MTSRLTPVQKDVLDRLRDGWELVCVWGGFELRKSGEPSRYVRGVTAWSLLDRGVLKRRHPIGVPPLVLELA